MIRNPFINEIEDSANSVQLVVHEAFLAQLVVHLTADLNDALRMSVRKVLGMLAIK